MIKVFCLTAHLNDGASIPRVHSIKHLEETGYPVQVRVGTELRDFEIWWADVVMIHRPNTAHHVERIEYAKSLGKKVWVDNDDDQLSVPIDHPAYFFFNSETTKGCIRKSNQLADLVTISNPQILETYRSLNKNIHYYPCAYDERLMPEPDYSPRNKVIFWRGGSSSHQRSMDEFAPSVAKLDQKDWHWVFIGDLPWKMIDGIKKGSWEAMMYLPTEALWNKSRVAKPAIQMVCLTDNQFTRSRSNMSMLDGTIAGAVTIARDFAHFKTPGVLTYKDTKEFEEIMSNKMKNYESAKIEVSQCWEYIQKHQTFKAINVKQMEVLSALCSN